jgi:hypothetical protein
MQCREICLCLQERASHEICERPGPSFQVGPVARGSAGKTRFASQRHLSQLVGQILQQEIVEALPLTRVCEQTSHRRAVMPRVTIGTGRRVTAPGRFAPALLPMQRTRPSVRGVMVKDA